jgi:hypothetical protein
VDAPEGLVRDLVVTGDDPTEVGLHNLVDDHRPINHQQYGLQHRLLGNGHLLTSQRQELTLLPTLKRPLHNINTHLRTVKSQPVTLIQHKIANLHSHHQIRHQPHIDQVLLAAVFDPVFELGAFEVALVLDHVAAGFAGE